MDWTAWIFQWMPDLDNLWNWVHLSVCRRIESASQDALPCHVPTKRPQKLICKHRTEPGCTHPCFPCDFVPPHDWTLNFSSLFPFFAHPKWLCYFARPTLSNGQRRLLHFCSESVSKDNFRGLLSQVGRVNSIESFLPSSHCPNCSDRLSQQHLCSISGELFYGGGMSCQYCTMESIFGGLPSGSNHACNQHYPFQYLW